MEDDMEDIYGDLDPKEPSASVKATVENHRPVTAVEPAWSSTRMSTLQLPGLEVGAPSEVGREAQAGIQELRRPDVPDDDPKNVDMAKPSWKNPSTTPSQARDSATQDPGVPQSQLGHIFAEEKTNAERPNGNTGPSAEAFGTNNKLRPTVQGLDAREMETPTQAEAHQAQQQEPVSQAEWEIDSSPYESSDDSSDTTSSGSDDEYKLLDPVEHARRLMEDDGNSDDGGPSRDAKGAHIVSHHETVDEPVEVPDITVTAAMKIEELGAVETIVGNIALIKAKTSGEHQVLEARSLLCLNDRTVIGVVSETLGRVLEPLYSVRFKSTSAIGQAGISKGTTIYYVPQHSTFVFTEALRNVKGSDASNIYDEEAAEDEVEFSDDEAEAEYKRNRKTQKQARRFARNGQLPTGQRFQDGPNMEPSPSINYDDEPQDDYYTPLSRPPNLHEMMEPGRGSLSTPTRAHRGSRNHRGGRGHQRGRGQHDSLQTRSHPPQGQLPQHISMTGSFAPYSPQYTTSPPSSQFPPSQIINSNGPAFIPSRQAYGHQQPFYGQYEPSHHIYSTQATYQNSQSQPPSSWAGAPDCGRLNITVQPDRNQHNPSLHQGTSPSSAHQFPPGPAINPWFFHGQHPQNSANR